MVENEKIAFRLYDSKECGMGWSRGVEVCYVLRGTGHLNIMKDKQWFLHENDVFVINMYDMYQILPETDGLVLALIVPEELALNLYPELEHMRIECFSFWFEDVSQERFDGVRKGIAEIFELCSKNDFQIQLRMRGLASSLLSKLISFFGKARQGTIEKKGD